MDRLQRIIEIMTGNLDKPLSEESRKEILELLRNDSLTSDEFNQISDAILKAVTKDVKSND